MNIYGEKVFLRAIEPEDMTMYWIMINDSEIEHLVGGWSFPVSKLEQQEWYERIVKDKNNLRFTIALADTLEPVGMASLVNIDWKNRSAFSNLKLKGDAPKRQGLGTDALMALLYYAFEELQLVRVDGSWVEYNQASIDLFKKCGFRYEGLKEKAVFKAGNYYGLYFGGVLLEWYREARQRLNWTPRIMNTAPQVISKVVPRYLLE